MADGEARAALSEFARQGRILTKLPSYWDSIGASDNDEFDQQSSRPRELLQQDDITAGDTSLDRQQLERQRLDELTYYLATMGYLDLAMGQQQSGSLFARGRNLRATETLAQTRNSNHQGHFWSSGLIVQSSALLLAIMGAGIAVKLALCKGGLTKRPTGGSAGVGADADPSQLSEVKTDAGETKLDRVSQQLGAYWTSASSTCTAVFEHRKRLKATTGLTNENNSTNKDHLDSPLPGKFPGFLFKRSRGSEVDELESNQTDDSCHRLVRNGKFRSSRSYIKSLIDTLAKTRNSEMATLDGDDQTISQTAISQTTSTDCSTAGSERSQAAGLESQMDISSAHLILAYMERHLEDKEQLRREWLELNAASPRTTAALQATNSTRINKLLLDRLAKVGTSKENLAKNYNPLVVAFDRNRVKLRGCPWLKQATGNQDESKSPASDYYNASYIYDDEPRKPVYIMSQGPTEQTVSQFWQVVWEQGVSVIVMLTRLNENNKRQCQCYWPASETDTEQPAPSGTSTRRSSVTSVNATPTVTGHHAIVAANTSAGSKVIHFDVLEGSEQQQLVTTGQVDESIKAKKTSSARFEVHLVSEHVSSSDYLVRNMYIINRLTGETRTISQFHYLAWPDNGVPANVKSLLNFRRKVHKSFRAPNSPILVHCSDGAGRSGSYVLIDLILERIKTGAKEIDLRATLEHIRDQRIACCATQKQFEFALVALAEEIQLIVDALPQ